MTNSIIAIKGNYIGQLDTIFRCFNYHDHCKDMAFYDADSFYEYLYKNYFEFSKKGITLWGIWFNNGWTIICDPEMVDTFNDESLFKHSNKMNSDVMTFFIQTNSSTYGFAKYGIEKQRSFFSTDGEIMDNSGNPTPEENGINLNGEVFVDDIIKLAKNFGMDIEGNRCNSFVVRQLSQIGAIKIDQGQDQEAETNRTQSMKNPWWKIW